jgi:hypothetical protein
MTTDSEYFRRIIRSPRQWQDRARDLVWAANRLRRIVEARQPLGFGRRRLSVTEALHQRHHSKLAVILLYSFAAENMLKAIWISKGYDPVGSAGQLKGEFAHHKLAKLAAAAKVRDLNARVLSQVTEFLESGRFPASKSPERGWAAHAYFPANVLSSLEELLTRLERALADTEHPELAGNTNLMMLGVRPRWTRTMRARRRTRR